MKQVLISMKFITMWSGIIFLITTTLIGVLWWFDELKHLSITRIILCQVVCLIAGFFLMWVSTKIKTEIL